MIRKKQESTEVVVDLTGPEGNAFALMGYAQRWSNQLGLDKDKILDEMRSGDYENLVAVLEKYFGDYVVFER